MACGEGYGSLVLAAHAADVVGVDANPEAHAHAAARYTRRGLRFERTLIDAYSEPRDAVVFGEISLSGALRPAPQAEARLREAAKLGFGEAWIPATPAGDGNGLAIHTVADLGTFMDKCFGIAVGQGGGD